MSTLLVIFILFLIGAAVIIVSWLLLLIVGIDTYKYAEKDKNLAEDLHAHGLPDKTEETSEADEKTNEERHPKTDDEKRRLASQLRNDVIARTLASITIGLCFCFPLAAFVTAKIADDFRRDANGITGKAPHPFFRGAVVAAVIGVLVLTVAILVTSTQLIVSDPSAFLSTDAGSALTSLAALQ